MSESLDVLVVGSGMVGALATHAFQSLGMRCLCLDQRPPPEGSVDTRAIVLTTPTVTACARYGIMIPALCALKQLSIEHQGKCVATLLAKDIGEEALGQVMDVGQALSTWVDKASVSWSSRLCALSYHAPGWSVTVETPEGRKTFHARYVIGADGADSMVRLLSGIGVRRRPLSSVASVLAVESAMSDPFLSFEDEGTMAYLPKDQGEGVVIWTRDRAVMRSEVDDLLAARAISVRPTAKIKHFPLQSLKAKHSALPGLFLVGHAKQCVPPVAAQGLNMGIRDVIRCIDLVRSPLSDEDKVRQYEQDWQQSGVADKLSHWPLYGMPEMVSRLPLSALLAKAYPYL